MTSLARPSRLPRRARGLLTLAPLLVAAACGGPAPGRDAGPPDAGSFDSGFAPDASREPCEADDDCDDGVSCTNDSCTGGFCRHGVDRSLCDDGVFCNGIERCDPFQGCLPASVRETCNDNDVCTIDRCDESSDSCSHAPRDLDTDGDPDFFCAGGGDCNDTNPNVSSLVNEVCSDFVDNDCDDQIDEADCGGPPHDTCDDPLDVSAGGTFTLDTNGAGADYTSSCGIPGSYDVVAHFHLETARSLSVDAESETSYPEIALSLRTACSDSTSEIACETDFYTASMRRRSLPAGDYDLVVATDEASELTLTVRFGDAVDPAANETCASAQDVSAGGTFTGSFAEVTDDVETSCGSSGQPDLIYSFDTTSLGEQDVQISVRSSTGSRLNWSVRPVCADETTDIRCASGAPASGRIHQLPAGLYYLVVEESIWSVSDFTLTIDFLPPTAPVDGDTCVSPLAVTVGTPLTGTLVDKEDDFDLDCGYHYRDAVHTFTIDEVSDVTVELDTGGYNNLAVRSTCGDATTELVCDSGTPGRAVLRNLAAGTYYVIGESSTSSGYTLSVDATTPPTVPVEVTGNDTCPTAHDIPAAGGLFHGSTTGMADDASAGCGGAGAPDAVYRLTLAASKHVVLATDGSGFDTALHVHRDACTATAQYCDDDGGEGVDSLIDQVLAEGTWYVVVDGYSSGGGEYFLDVTITDP